MRHRTLIPCVLLFACLAAAPAQVTYQFHNLIYDVPPKWWHGKTTPTYVVLFPKDTGGAFVYITRGGPCTGDLAAWAEQQMSAFNDLMNADKIKSEMRQISKTKSQSTKMKSMPAVLVSQQLKGQGRGAIARMGVAFLSAEGQGELVVLDVNDAKAAKSAAALFTQIVEGVRLVNKGATPLMPPATPGSLEGMFWSSSLTYMLGGMQSVNRYYLFDRSGKFYGEMPTDRPLVPFDYDATTDDHPDDGGHYTVDNGTLTMVYADGHRESMPVSPGDKDSLKLDGKTYSRLPLGADGIRLNGTWSSLSYTQFTPGSGVNGGVASSHSFTFHSDGTYQTDGFTGVSANFENGAGDRTGGMAMSHDAAKKSGTYDVKGGLMTLTAADGSVTRKTIVMPDDTQELIILGGSNLLNEAKKPKK